MLFNSAAFIIFLMGALSLYYSLPPAYRKWVLLISSYIFYGLWSVPYLVLLMAVTLIAYRAGIGIDRIEHEAGKRKALLLSLVFLAGVLVTFKYAGVLGELVRLLSPRGETATLFDSILVPLGISYYTFKLISYVMDVYWGKIAAEKDAVAFALYPAFFPQILSGPIQRSGDFLSQVKAHIPNNPSLMTSGLRLMLFGYFKKIVIADALAPFVNQVYSEPMSYHSLCVWMATYAYVFQLYADFSGFTDIAIGSGRLFGIQSPKNFNQPFYSPNLQVFWRNWHITLTRWLADYVFMPLRMLFRPWGAWGIAAAISVNFVGIGLWHAATWPFLAFGLFHALCMCVSVFTLKKRDAFFERFPSLALGRRFWATLITFHLWTFSEILFRGESMMQIQGILSAIFSWDFTKPWVLGFGKKTFLCLTGYILGMEAVHWLQSKGRVRVFLDSKPIVWRWGLYYGLVLLISLQYGHRSEQFIYFKF